MDLEEVPALDRAVRKASRASVVILALILALGLFLRAVDISENPPELFSDELINFVSARSVVEKGHDLHGNLTLYFSDRPEPRPPVYGYSAYVSSMIFGDGAPGIRAPAVFFGLVCIVLVYLITRELFRDERAALFAAFFMAIIPWSIHYSRIGWEPAAFLPPLLLAVYMMVYGIGSGKKWITVLSFGTFSITVYTYQAAPLYAFLFLAALVIIYRRYFLHEWKVLLGGSIVAGALVVPHILTIMNEHLISGRADRIFTFSEGVTPGSVGIFFHNYISHFKPSFLFAHGDLNLRHGAHTGAVYWTMLPLVLAGLVYLLRPGFDRKSAAFVLFWIAVFPLAAALTNDGVPHATRSLTGAPLLCILGGLGAGGLAATLGRGTGRPAYSRALAVLIVVSSMASLAVFAKKYYFEYPKQSCGAWECGHRDIFAALEGLKDGHKRACMGNLHFGNELQLVDYSARGPDMEIVRDMDDPECLEEGTLIVSSGRPRKFRRNSFLVKKVEMPGEMRNYFIYEVRYPGGGRNN